MTDETADSCALELRLQNRNAFIFATAWSLTYLAAPALYIGFVQAGLCKRLHTSDTLANLPATMWLAMVWVSVVVAWLFPEARLLKRILASAYSVMAAASAGVALVLFFNLSSTFIIGSLILHFARYTRRLSQWRARSHELGSIEPWIFPSLSREGSEPSLWRGSRLRGLGLARRPAPIKWLPV
ncbi:MAG: hypothetical protein EBT89_07895 [Opitutaceae bacterium]|nr:hypothetical protein [Opitutaceae bacterium]